MRTLTNLHCPECDAWLENTPSGRYSSCPNWHTKLLPPLTADELALVDVEKYKHLLDALPEVVREYSPGIGQEATYTIAGHEGKFRRVRTLSISTALFHVRKRPGDVIARCATLATGYGWFEKVETGI